jgi:energy-converting hydrogenase Eha subunit E
MGAVAAVPGPHGHGPIGRELTVRVFFAYASRMSKAGNTVVIAASVIAAIRLAREDKILNTPKAVATVGDSLVLAKTIYDRAVKTYPELFKD